MQQELLGTPMHAEHLSLGARMGGFAGYDMPLYYADGIIKEHMWTRERAGVFDVSHMGPIRVIGNGAAKLLEFVTPSLYSSMRDMTSRYTVMLNERGGIVDDLIVTRLCGDDFLIIANASRKDHDLKYLLSQAYALGIDTSDINIFMELGKSIIAVQGKAASAILSDVLQLDLSAVKYMHAIWAEYHGERVLANRTGYTGEDGFEIVIDDSAAVNFWRNVLAYDDARPVGLAARDTLRLEMGYPLYGADLNEDISPIEASLGWLIGKNLSFRGNGRVLHEKDIGVGRRRVGVILHDKGMLRAGHRVVSDSGTDIGYLSSGGYSPVLRASVGMGYLGNEYQKGSQAIVSANGKLFKVEVADMPFVPSSVYK